MKKIIFLVQWFRPTKEATSKEVNILLQYFKKNSYLHDLHLNKISKFNFNKKQLSYHFIFYPFFLPVLCLFTLRKIVHIYTGLTDRPYLSFLPKKRMIITSTNFFSKQQIKKKIKALKKTRKIIVEAEIQKKELLQLGLKENKIALIHPPVDLNKFNYTKAEGNFKILNATCPSRIRDFKRRGFNLLLELDQYVEKNTTINFAWRDGSHLIKNIIKNKKFNSLRFNQESIKDMNQEFAKNHCTIIPYTKFDSYLKLIPLSAIESLAAGKPLLVSSKTGIAEIVKKEKCGIVFEPNVKELLEAIHELRNNHSFYQKNCRKTAEKYFSHETFIKKYEQIYQELS